MTDTPVSVPGFSLDERVGDDGRVELIFHGELDLSAGAQVDGHLGALWRAGTPAILRLGALSFIDISGLRVIIDALEASARDGHHLDVDIGGSPAVTRLIDLVDDPRFTARLGGGESPDAQRSTK